MAAFFILKKAKNDKYVFDLKAPNNEIILNSQMYTVKSSAESGIDSVRKNSQVDTQYERKISSDGRHYFDLHAANKEVIGTSQMYSSAEAMEKGIASVKKNAPEAVIHDMALSAQAAKK